MSELEINTLAYLWRYGLFLKFSLSDQWFNNIAISTFLHSTAVDLPSSYSDRYLNGLCHLAVPCVPIDFSITYNLKTSLDLLHIWCHNLTLTPPILYFWAAGTKRRLTCFKLEFLGKSARNEEKTFLKYSFHTFKDFI